MKFITFKNESSAKGKNSGYRIGVLSTNDVIIDVTTLISNDDLNVLDLLDCFDIESGFLEKVKSATASENKCDFPVVNRESVRITAPIPMPGKIICVGLNYRNHAIESKMEIPKSPVIFSKFSTSVIGSNEAVIIPENSKQVDFEAELAVVIGRKAKNVKKADAMYHVFGYANFNDVSARDLQFADGQWQRGKSCDTFAPFGEFIVTKDEIENPHKLQIEFRLNGAILQNSNTEELIFTIPDLIEFISQSITLEPGDIIATGTPPGVGFARKPPVFLQNGDVMTVEIEGLGTLTNRVETEQIYV
ncbi:MAG: fumarylacetoacetate hydrolase family protein [Pyrinomonadaceae bacterium]|nr:fumarylacetoacetate hydrolase family protein [Pyrinomonadaceae bacterium]